MRALAAITLAAGLSLLGAAHAQNATINGMDCVYTALIPDYKAVAEVFLSSDLTEKETEEIDDLLESAKKDCAARFKYTPVQLETVGELGLYGSIVDYLSEELKSGGVSEGAVGGILDVYDSLTDDEVDILYAGDWRNNAAFLAKLKAMLIDAGIPDGKNMELALAILGATVLMEAANYRFMTEADAAAKRPTP